MSRGVLRTAVAWGFLFACVASVQTIDAAGQDRLQQLEERISRVEAQLRDLLAEVEILRKERDLFRQEAAPPKTTVELTERGLQFESPKEKLGFRARGMFQVDARAFVGGQTAPGSDSLLLRRARPILELKARQFAFRLMPDFAGASTSLMDAYMTWSLSPALEIRAGKMKSPVGLERLQSTSALALTERGLPTELVPNRDIGILLQGTALKKRLDFGLGLFNGAPDGASVIQDQDDNKDVVFRLFSHPYRGRKEGLWEGLGLGIAGTYGVHQGMPRPYQTTAQQPFFRFQSGALLDGPTWRLSPQGYFYRGPAGLMGEFVTSSRELVLRERRITARNSAWQLIGSYLLTGEDASYAGVRPTHEFEPGVGGFGAFELVFRVGQLTLDKDMFPNFADPGLNARRITGIGAGVNWYLNRVVKFTFDYETTGFNLQGASRQREHAIFTRMQFAY